MHPRVDGVGGRTAGGWLSNSDLHGLARDVGIAMAISVAIGVGAIALGLRLKRSKNDSNEKLPENDH